ncbi:MAG: metallophosphatase family protein [Thermoflavifilum sp.]|nr:metallophosphatase family protein [Thermoflavifilum sp.]
MVIGILSDTHGSLPIDWWKHFTDVDELWHAGDIGDIAILEELSQHKPVKAVYGNIDGQDIRQRIPESQYFHCAGLQVWMVHIGGYPPRYTPEIRAQLDRLHPHIFICGHSHILKIIPDHQRKLLHINPGAAGMQGWHQVRTAVKLYLSPGKIERAEVIEWPRTVIKR